MSENELRRALSTCVVLRRNAELERNILLQTRPRQPTPNRCPKTRRYSVSDVLLDKRPTIIQQTVRTNQNPEPIRRRRVSEAVRRPTFNDFLAGLRKVADEQKEVNNVADNAVMRPSSFISRGRRPSLNKPTASTSREHIPIPYTTSILQQVQPVEPASNSSLVTQTKKLSTSKQTEPTPGEYFVLF